MTGRSVGVVSASLLTIHTRAVDFNPDHAGRQDQRWPRAVRQDRGAASISSARMGRHAGFKRRHAFRVIRLHLRPDSRRVGIGLDLMQ